MISWVKALCRKVEVSEEALALSVFSAVGPSDHFLNTQHTFDHFRKRWYPALFERANFESWSKEGGTTLADRAAARVGHVLETHRPEELTKEKKRKLQDILGTSERPS
jgi:trimethylamine--corrinoid protein Co-methyltransferase